MEDKEFIGEVIDLYQSMPTLWKIKSKEYSNRVLKNSAYDMLVEKLKEKNPEANRETAVKKINNMRTAYRRELKKKRDSLKSGAGADDEYVPHLWYFDLLSFLDDQEESREGRNTMETIILEESEPRAKKPKDSTEDKLIKLACQKLEETSNTTNSLADSWNVQYDEMQASQKIVARKIIADVLFHGCIGNLHIGHTIEISNILNTQTTPMGCSNSHQIFRNMSYHPTSHNSIRVPTPLNSSSSASRSTASPGYNDNAVYILGHSEHDDYVTKSSRVHSSTLNSSSESINKYFSTFTTDIE